MKHFAAAGFALCLLAQDTPLFTSNVRLVEVYATVFSQNGRAVDGLRREQFQVLDDGADQPIQIFESAEKSVACALLLDSTGSMANVLPALRNAAHAFIAQLRPADRVAVYSFSDHVDELAALSADKSAASRSLSRLRAGGRTALFDAISQVALAMARYPGKKAIVVLTDGGDNASVLTSQSAMTRSRKSGIPVFAIAEGNALKDEVASALLHQLAKGTGGQMYKAAESKNIDRVFAAIAGDLQNGYLLAFPQPAEAAAPPWHKLEIVVKDTAKPLKVRARTEYPGEQ